MHEDLIEWMLRGRQATLVIAEDADDMWLTRVYFPAPPELGATFHFRGEVWEVVWSESCGCRAEPAIM